MMLSDRFESFLSAHSSRLWTLARGAAVTALLVASAHAQATLTNSFSFSPWASEGADIPGMTFGPNASGQNVVWVGSYLSAAPLSWTAGNIVELNPATGAVIAQHPPPTGSWSGSGPCGLAHDASDHLWVASYNDARVYKVRISTWSVVSSFATSGRPLGGLAFDGTSVWLTKENQNTSVYQFNQTGTSFTVHATPSYVKAGLEYAWGFLFLVDTTNNRIEARRTNNFSEVVSPSPYNFSPARGSSSFGDLAIDPNTGDGYWGARGLTQLYKLHVLDVTMPNPSLFCFGDGSGASCPCAPGPVGGGCANSGGNGARLTRLNGTTSVAANNLTLNCTGMMFGSYAIFCQGTTQLNGGLGATSAFSDGLDCVGGSKVRLALVLGLGGIANLGQIASRGGATPGSSRYYQVIYRNNAPYCTPATLNTSNGLAVLWSP